MKDLLKFITCGSVDDGKSTLIGHILYDSKLLFADQERALELDSRVGSRGGAIDYSLLLDGLTEEREQGITIDVAYRYFTTQARSFIVADTPGHEEYTRNMAVGASFAQLAVILADASRGILVQTRRHARICALMGIRYFIFAVNKMDLVDYSENVFRGIEEDIEALSQELELENVEVIPVSATEGDNVTTHSERMPWYAGGTLLQELEKVDIDDSRESGFYLPVQRVCRPDREFRGYEGQVESGRVRVGDKITVWPSAQTARVSRILVGDSNAQEAGAGQPVTVTLDREIDISRGCVIERGAGIQSADTVQAQILWMDDEPLSEGRNVFVQIGTRSVPGVVSQILYAVDVNTGQHRTVETLNKNELALCRIRFVEKIPVDTFDRHRTLGELILIDRVSFQTSAGGVVTKVEHRAGDGDHEAVIQELRAMLKSQKPATFVFRLSETAKDSAAASKGESPQAGVTLEKLAAAEKELTLAGRHTYLYIPDRQDHPKYIADILNEAGLIVLLAIPAYNPVQIAGDSIIDFGQFRDQTGDDPKKIAKYILQVTAPQWWAQGV